MIICTEHDLSVGEHVHGPTTDSKMELHEVAFVVLRVATHAEYVEHAMRVAGTVGDPFNRPMNFYEVAMD